MASEKLKEWIKSKRKEGVSDERIRKSLERTGHDPSVLDELDNPFGSDGSNKETSEEDNDDTEASDKVSDSSQQDSGEEFEFKFSDQDSSDTESIEEDKTSSGSEEKSSQKIKSKFESIKERFPSSPSRDHSLNVSSKKIVVGLLLLLIIAGGIATYSFIPDNFNLNSSGDEETELEPGSLEQLDAQHSGCPDSALRVQSVSSSDGVTTANVRVSREEAQVALIVMQGDEVLEFATESILGESEMTVEALGDQVKLRPLGCKDRFSLRDY